MDEKIDIVQVAYEVEANRASQLSKRKYGNKIVRVSRDSRRGILYGGYKVNFSG